MALRRPFKNSDGLIAIFHPEYTVGPRCIIEEMPSICGSNQGETTFGLGQRVIRLALGGAIVCGVFGCDATPVVASGSHPTKARFAPIRLEVHPLSHIYVQDNGSVVFDASVELLDADGFPVRGVGVLELELHQGGRSGEAIMLRRTWSRDLNDADVNAESFDDATRTYIVQEHMEYAEVPRSPHLTASLRRPGKAALTDSADLPLLGAGPSDAKSQGADSPLSE
ncbi:MAG: hypothetical protein GY894_04915 [Planctomycetes bacterium]|jgi:hypothetical protein|nr:hypothetical protein [Planctomycetota bacterium]